MLALALIHSDLALLFVIDRCLQLSRILELVGWHSAAAHVDRFGELLSTWVEH